MSEESQKGFPFLLSPTDLFGVLFYMCTYTRFFRNFLDLLEFVKKSGLEDFINRFKTEIIEKQADPRGVLSNLSATHEEMLIIKRLVRIVFDASINVLCIQIQQHEPTKSRDEVADLAIKRLIGFIQRRYYESVVFTSVTELEFNFSGKMKTTTSLEQSILVFLQKEAEATEATETTEATEVAAEATAAVEAVEAAEAAAVQAEAQPSQQLNWSSILNMFRIFSVFYYLCRRTNFLREHPGLRKYVIENDLEDFLNHIETEISRKHSANHSFDPRPDIEKLYLSGAKMKMVTEIVWIVLKAAAYSYTEITQYDRPIPLGIDHVFHEINTHYYEMVVIQSSFQYKTGQINEQTGERKLMTYFELLVQEFLDKLRK
jgi:hypothetical protein